MSTRDNNAPIGFSMKPAAAVLLCVAIVVLSVVVHRWKLHILYWSQLTSGGAAIKALPVTDVECSGVTEAWSRYDAGQLYFRVPVQLENAIRKTESLGETFTFESPDFTIVVFPVSDDAHYDRIESDIAARTKADVSAMEALAQLYRMDSEDFRWSMTDAQLLQHQQLSYLRRMFCSSAVRSIETRLGEHVQVLIGVVSDTSSWLEWRVPSANVAGMIAVEAKNGTLDPKWMRSIACTLSVEGASEMETAATTNGNGDVATENEVQSLHE